MAYSVSPVEHGSLSVGRHWRIQRMNGGLSPRNAMDSTVDSSVVSRCPLRVHCSAMDDAREKNLIW